MKMTKEQVADLLLKANEDLSNCEYYCTEQHRWISASKDLEVILGTIRSGGIYRIKDNSVKEVTLDLLGRKCVHKQIDFTTTIITAVSYNQIHIHCGWLELEEFNDNWQLVED